MFLDTSGLFSLLHSDESNHADAVTFFTASSFKLTTSYVLAELIALAHARNFPRRETLLFVAALQDSSEVSVVYVNEPLHRAAFSLLQQRLDKSWSLCDAVSLTLMQCHGITEALTTDQHFEQAGFTRLLRP